MNPNLPAIPAGDERLAGGLMGLVQQLQRNRRKGLDPSASPMAGSASEGASVLNALRNKKQNEQEQNAAGAPGALQEEGGQERGRQRDVGQGEAQGRFRQGSQVPGTEENPFRRKVM